MEFVDAPEKVRLKSTPVYTPKVTPENAVNADVFWGTSNRVTAEINEKTGMLKPKATGKVTVTAYTENGKTANKRILIYTTNQVNKYGFTAKSAGAHSVKLTWKAIPNADGYIVYRNGKQFKTLDGKTTTFTNMNLIKGKTYKYKIRAFYTVDGKKDLCTMSMERAVKPVAAKAAR